MKFKIPYYPTLKVRALICKLGGSVTTCVSKLAWEIGLAKNIGEVREWLNRPVLKTGIPFGVSRVRIPPSPLDNAIKRKLQVKNVEFVNCFCYHLSICSFFLLCHSA